MKPSRLVIACLLDRTGTLRNLRVLESASGETTAKVLVALANWKFSPVFRGDQPIEVSAILGFNIDTR
jgi:outer membrane biosynthesis protein TonB